METLHKHVIIERKFDEDGHVIYNKNNMGLENWYEYDEFGRMSCSTDSIGTKFWFEYDNEGVLMGYTTNLKRST